MNFLRANQKAASNFAAGLLTLAVAGSILGDNRPPAIPGTVVGWGDLGYVLITNAIAVSAKEGYNPGPNRVILLADGTVAKWESIPQPAGLTNLIAVVAGANHSLGLRSDGTVVEWWVGSDLLK